MNYDIKDISELDRLESLSRPITMIDVENTYFIYCKYVENIKGFKHSNRDASEILRLAKVAVAVQSDMDSIYELYKKYIKPKAIMYRLNCNCSTSLSRYYQTLLEWYSSNGSLFSMDYKDIDNLHIELKSWYNKNKKKFK
jgi:hypothetical protein